ncbi:MAG: IS1595 family transposase [Bacteroidota bacterium]|nr:IS1595 family transposase [Bacteroidota bacterium]
MDQVSPYWTLRHGYPVNELLADLVCSHAVDQWEAIVPPMELEQCVLVRTSEHDSSMPFMQATLLCQNRFRNPVPQAATKNSVLPIYLEITSLKGVSRMKLHRDIGVTRKTAWFMLQLIRDGLVPDKGVFDGPVEMDEAYLGSRETSMYETQRVKASGGEVWVAPVVGIKDRAVNKITGQAVESTDGETLRGLFKEFVGVDASLYTDSYAGNMGKRRNYESAKQSSGEFVRGQAHTNGVESFWAALKWAYHHISKGTSIAMCCNLRVSITSAT